MGGALRWLMCVFFGRIHEQSGGAKGFRLLNISNWLDRTPLGETPRELAGEETCALSGQRPWV